MSNFSAARVWQARWRYWLGERKASLMRVLGRGAEADDSFYRIAASLHEKRVASGDRSDDALDQSLSEAMDLVIEDGPPAVAEALKADAPRMLADRESLDSGFGKRLRKRWGSAFDLYMMVAVANQEIGTQGYQDALREVDADEATHALLEAVSGLQARTCRQSLEVYALLEGGFPKGAHAISRSMHEAAVVASVLCEFGTTPGHEDLGLRFLSFDHMTNLMDAEEHQRHAERLGYEPFSDEEMAALRTTKAEVLKRFPDLDAPLGWARNLPGLKKRDFRGLEALARLDHLRPYYTWASHEVHAYPKGVRLNQSGLDGRQWKLAGRTNAGLADPAQSALIALNQVTASLLTLPGVPSPSRLVASRAAMILQNEACHEFVRIEDEIAAEHSVTAF